MKKLLFLLTTLFSYSNTSLSSSTDFSDTSYSQRLEAQSFDENDDKVSIHKHSIHYELQRNKMNHSVTVSDITIFFTLNEINALYETCSEEGKNLLNQAIAILHKNKVSPLPEQPQPHSFKELTPPSFSQAKIVIKEEYF